MDGLVSVLVSGPASSLLAWPRKVLKEDALSDQGGPVPQALNRLEGSFSGQVPPPIETNGKRLDFSSGPVLMGVLNVTPDSFYDGGRYLDLETARTRAQQLIREGVDIIDIGGASSRPGSELVSDEVQKERVLPLIREIRNLWDGWISVDTYASDVAREAIEQGADMVNDISAGSIDPRMKEVVRTYDVPCILMHMQGSPRDMQRNPSYDSLLSEIIDSLEQAIEAWCGSGVQRDRILIDPGIGFGKTLEDNLCLLKNLKEFAVLNRPIVLGTSRKSFIGTVLKQEAPDRLNGTLATHVIGAQNGAHVFRVHDVLEARHVLTMTHAVMEA